MKLRDSDLTIIGSIFKSSVKIELEYNEFHNLAPLDCLLIGDNLKLRLLSLQCCEIDENCIVDFFRKLPQMTHIRHIDLNGNPFLTNSHEWRNVLLHMVQQNASLECITISTDNEDRRALYSRLDLAFGTNRVSVCLLRSLPLVYCDLSSPCLPLRMERHGEGIWRMIPLNTLQRHFLLPCGPWF